MEIVDVLGQPATWLPVFDMHEVFAADDEWWNPWRLARCGRRRHVSDGP